MIDDPIVEEIRKHRKEFSDKHGSDLKKMGKALQEKEKERLEKIASSL